MTLPDEDLNASNDRPHALEPLTELSYWDARWTSTSLPDVATRGDTRPGDELLDALDICFSGMHGAQVLEIGGAPGHYLAYLAQTHGLRATAIDYSPVGCLKVRENFRMLGLDVAIHQLDVFDADMASTKFDAVYSLGFVEHFADLREALDAHVRFVRPGGLVVVGAPNMTGAYGMAFRLMGPEVLRTHNQCGTDLDAWNAHFAARGLDKQCSWTLGGLSLGAISGPLAGVPLDAVRRQGRRVLEVAARLQNAMHRANYARYGKVGLERVVKSHWWGAYSLAAYRLPSDANDRLE